MNALHKTTLALSVALLALPVWAQITFYESDNYRGRAFTATRQVTNFESVGFNDRASSVVVESGRWEVCDDANFSGSCVVLRPGSYASLNSMGLNDRLSSVRKVGRRRDGLIDAPPPLDEPPYAYRRRPVERMFEAEVTSARAVVGAPTERCWVERQQAVQEREAPNTGRAVLGGLLGGVIGHQIGGGSGRDLATAGGVIAGAVLGANSGRQTREVPARDVRRCTSVPSTKPTYWDVGYNFRGVQHQVQMTQEPGATISVNRAGEPRL